MLAHTEWMVRFYSSLSDYPMVTTSAAAVPYGKLGSYHHQQQQQYTTTTTRQPQVHAKRSASHGSGASSNVLRLQQRHLLERENIDQLLQKCRTSNRGTACTTQVSFEQGKFWLMRKENLQMWAKGLKRYSRLFDKFYFLSNLLDILFDRDAFEVIVLSDKLPSSFGVNKSRREVHAECFEKSDKKLIN